MRDPRLGPGRDSIRYVGKISSLTTELAGRLSRHICAAKRGARTRTGSWISQLLALGMRPIIEEVERGSLLDDPDGWKEAERRWIAHYLSIGCDLTNQTEGGDGCCGFRHSEESKAKMAAAKKGKPLSAEHRAKLSRPAHNKGKPQHPNSSFAGRKHSDESLRKIGDATKVRIYPPRSEESREKTSRALKGHTPSPESIARMRVGQARRRERERGGTGQV